MSSAPGRGRVRPLSSTLRFGYPVGRAPRSSALFDGHGTRQLSGAVFKRCYAQILSRDFGGNATVLAVIPSKTPRDLCIAALTPIVVYGESEKILNRLAVDSAGTDAVPVLSLALSPRPVGHNECIRSEKVLL